MERAEPSADRWIKSVVFVCVQFERVEAGSEVWWMTGSGV